MAPWPEGLDPKLRRAVLLRVAVEANVRCSMRQLAETPEGRRI
jgi:hypothetical protein